MPLQTVELPATPHPVNDRGAKRQVPKGSARGLQHRMMQTQPVRSAVDTEIQKAHLSD